MEDFKKLCVCESKGEIKIYKYQLTKTSIAEGVFESHIFKKSSTMKEEKVVMLLGATGVGKTTIINRMVNYIFDVNYTDTFRFQLIEETAQSETKSQTKNIHKYTIHHKQFPYILSIIDTPGICSTGGKKEDRNTIEKIRYLFESGKVETINAICIVEKYGTIRLTENQIYVLQTITNIFGKDVCEAIFIMATSCDDIYDDTETPKPPPLLESFAEQKIHFKTHFVFNNKDIYTKPVANIKSRRGQAEMGFWDTSTNTFKLFFERLEVTTPISLKLTKEILQKKQSIIYVHLPYLVRKLGSNVHEIEALEQDRKIIEEMISNPDTSDYTWEREVVKVVMVDIKKQSKYFSTRCKNCNKICHYPCSISSDNLIKDSSYWCSAMTWLNLFNVYCTICSCGWKDHEQIKKREKFKTIKKIVTSKILKQQYMHDMEGAVQEGKKTCEDKMLSAYNELLQDFKTIQEYIDYINRNSLSRDATTIKEFVDDVIDGEEQEQEDGYKQRIHYLKRLVEMRDEDSSTNEVQQAIAFIQGIQNKYS